LAFLTSSSRMTLLFACIANLFLRMLSCRRRRRRRRRSSVRGVIVIGDSNTRAIEVPLSVGSFILRYALPDLSLDLFGSALLRFRFRKVLLIILASLVRGYHPLPSDRWHLAVGVPFFRGRHPVDDPTKALAITDGVENNDKGNTVSKTASAAKRFVFRRHGGDLLVEHLVLLRVVRMMALL